LTFPRTVFVWVWLAGVFVSAPVYAMLTEADMIIFLNILFWKIQYF